MNEHGGAAHIMGTMKDAVGNAGMQQPFGGGMSGGGGGNMGAGVTSPRGAPGAADPSLPGGLGGQSNIPVNN